MSAGRNRPPRHDARTSGDNSSSQWDDFHVGCVLEAEVRERVAWLKQYYPRMTACRVLLTMPHRHHQAGRQFHVTVDVRLPGGGPIVVSRQTSGDDPLLRHAGTAIHAAFDAARRQIQDFAREQRVQS